MEPGRRQSDRSFHESPDLLAVVTSEGVLKVVNYSWEKALGYRLDELIGRAFFKLADDHDRATALKLVNPRLAAAGSEVMELALRCKDLSYRSFLWNRRYMAAEQAVFISGRDITERKKMETTQNLRLYAQYAQGKKTSEPSGGSGSGS
jgi:PAS domain S-box-containing protein